MSNVKDKDGQVKGMSLEKLQWLTVREGLEEEDDSGGLDINTEEVNRVLIPAKEHGSPECIEAKKKELRAFNDFRMFTEVKDVGQDRLLSRWVMTDKSISKVKKVKARLVCRGFEEPVEVQSDSPCGSKETLHLLLTI